MDLSKSRAAIRWLVLLALTLLLTGLCWLLHLSAALLIGSMGAAIVLATRGANVAVPAVLFQVAQAVLGCMIARAMVPSIFHEMVRDWPLFVSAVVFVLVAACTLGIVLTRRRVLPGTTALWGSFPGAATAMVLMAEAYGADIRLVAFMQYLRVVMVALVASGVARVLATHAIGAGPAAAWLGPVAWPAFGATLALAGLGLVLGRFLRVPAAPLLVPMVIGALLQDGVGFRIELPPPLLAAAYSVIGWSIGRRFTPEILRHAAHALPRVAGAILVLIAACGLFAGALVVVAGIDPMTAYLATSPGGADTVAIIAASNKVDVPFVMALQMTRFIIILLIGPRLARFIAGRLEARTPATLSAPSPHAESVRGRG